MKRVPKMTTDEAGGKFLAQDLSDLDFSQFKPVQFEFRAKDAQINMRLPAELLLAVRRKAEAEGMPYQRFIRAALERAVTGKKRA